MRGRGIGFLLCVCPLAAIISVVTLSSCALTRRLRAANEVLYLRERLAEIEKSALGGPFRDLIAPYPVPEFESSQELDELERLAIETSDTGARLRIARLRADGRTLLRIASPGDTALLAEGYLLTGNAGEALRLLGGKGEKRLKPFALLLAGDSLRGVRGLKELALMAPQSHSEELAGLAAVRILTHLEPEEFQWIDLLKKGTGSDIERQFLGVKKGLLASEEDEEKALEKEALSLLYTKKLSRSEVKELGALLMPSLLKGGLLVELFDLLEAFPNVLGHIYPYSLIRSFPEEVELMRAYESPIRTEFSPGKEADSGSFTALYGQVARTPNWGMTYAGSGGGKQYQGRPPGALYDKVKAGLINLLTTPIR